MANLGPTRLVSRAQIEDTDAQAVRQGDKRCVQSYIGTNYIRDHFTVAATTGLNGHAPDEENVVGVPTWLASNLNIQEASDDVINSTDFPNGRFGNGLIDVGSLTGSVFISGILKLSATPATDIPMHLFFRVGAGSIFGAAGRPSLGWAVTLSFPGGDLRAELYRDQVQQGAAATLVGQGVGHAVIEVWLDGSSIEVWLNGVRAFDITDAAHQNETRHGLGTFVPGSGDTKPTWDEFFVTSVPSCPGATDTDTISSSLALAPVAAGNPFEVKIRWARIGSPITLQPAQYIVQLLDDQEALLPANQFGGDTAWQGLPGGAADYGYFTRAFSATADGTGTGAARSSMFRVRILIRRLDGLATDWAIDSENVSQVLPANTVHDFGRGYAAASVGILSVTKPDALVGPDVAYPEEFTIQIRIAARPYRLSLRPTFQTIQGGLLRESFVAQADWTSAPSDSTAGYNGFRCDSTYLGVQAGVGVRILSPRKGATYNSDPVFVWTGPPAGFRVGNSDGVTTIANADWIVESGAAAFAEDAFDMDPRVTIAPHAEGDSVLDGTPANPNLGNDTIYVISADALFTGAHFKNAKGANLAGESPTHRLKRPNGTVAATSTGPLTDVNGFSWPNDWTQFLTAPAGNWTQEAELDTNLSSQTLGFASAFTDDRTLDLQAPDESAPGQALTLLVSYRKSDGTVVALDAAPLMRVYTTSEATGADTDSLVPTAMTRVGTTEVWKLSWTPATVGRYKIEVRARFAGGGIERIWPITIRPRVAMAVGPFVTRF